MQPISYIETSAKEAVKVEGAFLEVVQLALINSAQQPPDMWVALVLRYRFAVYLVYKLLLPAGYDLVYFDKHRAGAG